MNEPHEAVVAPRPIIKWYRGMEKVISQPLHPMMFQNGDAVRLAEELLQSLQKHGGMGLAGIQIGLPLRIFVIFPYKKQGLDWVRDGEPLVFINPEITWRSAEKVEAIEGCLSIPEQRAAVKRPAQVKVSYQDVDGSAHELEADGLLARCIQHEYDHAVLGKFYWDHLSSLKRSLMQKRHHRYMQREAERQLSR